MEQHYEKTMAEIEKAIAGASARINGLTNNVSRSINVLSASQPKGLSAAERDVLLSFEALCVESLWRTAWMFHERGEHDNARQCLAIGHIVQQTVMEATEHRA